MSDGTSAEGTGTVAQPLRDTIMRSSTYLAVGAAFLLLLLAGMVTKLTDASRANFFEDLVGALLALAGGVLLAGVVGIAVNRALAREQAERGARRDRADELDERRAFVEQQVVQLWELREQVISAAVLIAAHRSAKTYGEQLRTIIGVRTKLSDVRGVVKRREDVDSEVFEAQINHALSFLNPLIDEYRSTYLEVSRRQRLDEAANGQLVDRHVSAGRGDDEPHDPWAESAWNALVDQSRFLVLVRLIEYGSLDAEAFGPHDATWETTPLTLEFLDPIAIAADALRANHDVAVRDRLETNLTDLAERRSEAFSTPGNAAESA